MSKDWYDMIALKNKGYKSNAVFTVEGLLLLIAVLLSGCSIGNQLAADKPSGLVTLSYEKGTVIDDAFLEKLPYFVPTEADTRCLAVIKCDGKNTTFQEYVVKIGDSLDLQTNVGDQLIISQYANRTIAYTWQIENLESLQTISLVDRTWMRVPQPDSEKDKEGANRDRQNFYFKALKAGTEPLRMHYQHQIEARGEVFEIQINISVGDSSR